MPSLMGLLWTIAMIMAVLESYLETINYTTVEEIKLTARTTNIGLRWKLESEKKQESS